MDTKEILFRLSDMHGVSGDEGNVLRKLADIIKHEFSLDCTISNGNLTVDLGTRENGKKHVLIDAHIDEIGMICTYIDDEGFIVPSNIGGMDYRLLPAQKVIVHGKKDIFGVVAAIPPHLSDGESVNRNMDNIRIDTGYSAEELKKIVPLGSTISYDVKSTGLINDRITGKSLDNRAGAAVLLKLIELLEGKPFPCSLTLLFSSAEEIGERGAKTACFDISPDIAIAVDTSFALTAGEDPKKCGHMGKGTMIGISPSLSRGISNMLIDTASKENIPYQTEVMSGLTGTNADQFSVSRGGVKTCTCSVPIKHMHTPAETVDIQDIENTAVLLAGFIRRVK